MPELVETLRENLQQRLVALCPFVDECKRQCTPADQTNCWSVHTEEIIKALASLPLYVKAEDKRLPDWEKYTFKQMKKWGYLNVIPLSEVLKEVKK